MKRIWLPALVSLLLVGCASAESETVGSGVVQANAVKSSAVVPDSAAAALKETRCKVSFPVFIPTVVPQGLTMSISGLSPVHINYAAKDGRSELLVVNGPVGCCLDADPRKTGASVTIRGGIIGHYLNERPEFGGPILWWQEAGSYVALSGPNMDKDRLVSIANSMSATAEP